MADNISSSHDYFTISLTDANHFSSSSSIDGFQFQKNSYRTAQAISLERHSYDRPNKMRRLVSQQVPDFYRLCASGESEMFFLINSYSLVLNLSIISIKGGDYETIMSHLRK